MKVTGFDLKKSHMTTGKSLGFGRVIIEDVFEVDIQIMDGQNGAFVSWPSKKGKDNKWYKLFRIVDKELSEKIQDQIIFYFEQNIKNQTQPSDQS